PMMNARALLVAVSLSCVARASCDAQPTVAAASYTDIVRRSGFIFQGTVQSIGTATPTVRAEPNTAVVLVTAVLEALPPVGNITGHQVTVRLRSPREVREGQSATFYTYVYSAGQSLGLQAVAILPLEERNVSVARIRAARDTLSDQRLARRLASAQLVVLGTAGDAIPARGSEERRGEHDPLWSRVPIRVEVALKGNPRGPTVVVNVARSDDPAWERSPKPKPGDYKVFLLQPAKGPQFYVPGPFLIDSLDMLDAGQTDRVRRLLRSRR
ncbi:MAG TPA: hypothetical protein VHM30_14110, partial [Gemmatimonadaceae bacterium]|nr:hypothetical protein [Gemmatimonadaceae bacterium]